MALLMELGVTGNTSNEYRRSQEFADACYELECEVEKLAKKIFNSDEISGIEVSE